MLKLNAQELRTLEPDLAEYAKIPKHDITIILDNVLDTYNVGSVFRLADAIAAKEVILCGETLTPPNSRIKKASINTWQWVYWSYQKTAVAAIDACRKANPLCKIIAVEQDPRSVQFNQIEYAEPLAIIVGNETYGVAKEALDMCDTIAEIPMWGVNKSLNVMVSCGIILFNIYNEKTSHKVM